MIRAIFQRFRRTGVLLVLALATAEFAHADEGDEKTLRPVADEIALFDKDGRTRAKQRAFARLGANPDPAADAVLVEQFKRFRAGELDSRLWLDLFEAAAKREDPELKRMLAEREADTKRPAAPLGAFHECMEGGDGEAGRAVFSEKPEAGCIRCHIVDGKGGQIGPDLTWLRHSVDRNRLMEALILPNATMAVGFSSALLELKDGEEISGIVTGDNATELTITSVADGKKRVINQNEIAKRTPLPSPMPPHFGAVLSKREIRDLIEFLAKGD